MLPHPSIWSLAAIYLVFGQIAAAQGGKIDAFRYEICGRFSPRSWQEKESAYNCKRGRSVVVDSNRTSSCSGRIINGFTANDGEFPSFVRLEIPQPDGGPKICGGTLIHSNLVITAAHCLEGATRMWVYFGSNEKREQEKVGVTGWCIHEHQQHTPYGTINDLAIIKLERNLEYIPEQIWPACLRLDQPHVSNAVCAVAGFGLTNDRDLPYRLMTTSLMRNCDRSLPYMSCYSRPKSKERGGTHSGDSGSGLYCFDNCEGSGQRSFLVAIDSTGATLDCNADYNAGRRCFTLAADLYEMSGSVMDMIKILHDGEDVGRHFCLGTDRTK